jgi:nucleoside-diphosphate-sugar epimerase
MNRILEEDIKAFSLPQELADELRGTTIMITGATGLIGSTLVRCLYSLDLGVRFVLPVRSREKAEAMFAREADAVTIVETDLCKFFDETLSSADYIIHCASPTDGKYMSSYPVETFMLAVDSTRGMLEYARRNGVKGLVYVSSIEYYGQVFDDEPIGEAYMGYIDRRSARSSYPLGKQAAEYLAVSYALEYDVPVKIARLTQVFGAGISRNDNRVFAQFARSVIADENIYLHTEGTSAKPYCYTTDAAAALMFIMLKGLAGEAYNVATPGTYMTIRELAEMMRNLFNKKIDVEVTLYDCTSYASVTTVNLDSRRLQSLGWRPRYGMEQMLTRLVDYLKSEN